MTLEVVEHQVEKTSHNQEESMNAIPHQPRALSDKEKARLQKLTKRLRREVGQAIVDFNMIEEGDRIMVCLSGGKDSYTLLDLLINLQKYAPVNFSIIAVNIDQQQPGFPKEVLPNYLSSIGVEYRIVNEDTYSVVKSIIAEGKTTCSLCSRLRRGIIYRIAQEEKCTKIALGHHRDDMIETLFLNMFFAGKMKSMPAKLVSDNNLHTVIRPLAYCREKDIIKYAELKDFPIIPCNLCGSQPNLQRAVIKQMLNEWDSKFPGRIETIFRSMQDVIPSHLHDINLYDFVNISSENEEKLRPAGTKTGPVNILASSKDGVITSDIRANRLANTSPVVDNRPNRSKDHLLAKQEHMLVGDKQSHDLSATQQVNEQASEQFNQGAQKATSPDMNNDTAQRLDSHYTQALEKYATREPCADNMDYLDELAAQELFGTTDYNALALLQEEQAKMDELEISDDTTIPGLKIKQL